jgi:hypothetical protein
VRTHLNVADPDALEDMPVAAAEDTPDVLFTSLVGSKGLSAEHVFIAGMNNNHFPRNPGAVTDDEICSLIVALSRTRKRCHVISFRFFGAGGLRPERLPGLDQPAPRDCDRQQGLRLLLDEETPNQGEFDRARSGR